MTTAAVLIPDGVGVRNFVIGQFLHKLARWAEPHIFHVVPDRLLKTVTPGLNGEVKWYPLTPYHQTRLILGLQYSLGYAQMYWADTQSMRRLRVQTAGSTWKIRALVRSSRFVGRASASPARMRLLDAIHGSVVLRRPEVAYYRQLLERIRPSVLFCSHQRPSVVVPAVLAARQLGIPTASFIFSWDNITSKGRIIAPFDHYLVWSDHMRKELLRYYPDVTPENVHVVGTPQFDPYADPSLAWSRNEFFQRIGADPGRPLICYSGGDPGTCPEDQDHVAVLMKLIRSGQIRGNPQVLVRPVPVEDGRRYEKVRREFPELIYAQPEWIHPQKGDWSGVIPLPSDVQFLANLTRYADLNINLGSTMTLDFGLHDKPVVNIAFDVANPPIFGMPVWDYYYFFEHYRPVVEYGAARFARSPDDLAEYVNQYLQNPALDREGRRRLADLQVGTALGQSSEQIVQALQQIVH